ncbi:MAG: sensor domain-containing diguanylate cyclase, partial [Sulfuricurvum sp.]|nr:sensor domain-containing diguanylate cyclase [Sulfuricurvum sp.]
MNVIQQYSSYIRECVNDFSINVDSIQVNASNDLLYTHAIAEHKKLLLALLLSTTTEEIDKNTKELVHFTIEHDISYLFLYSELVTVTRKLLGNLIEKKDLEHIEEINRFFSDHEERISVLYLQKFLNQLKLKSELRLSHISLMPDKKFMIHYESHIQWILNLILYIQQNEFDDKHPELNPNHCEFGRWMHSATTSYLLSTSHFKMIEQIHINLHDLAANVINYCKCKEFRPSTLIHLMQKIDDYSLEIGNEIAFLNEIEESARDPLTHLLTRRLFNKIMLNTLDISKATGREFALMMCDLDHFKLINDIYGHEVGDVVLQHFSGILEHTLRKSDYIFRFGGEEFIILLPMTSKEETLMLAQKVCDATASGEVIIEEVSIRYTVSIGTITVHIDNTLSITQDTI